MVTLKIQHHRHFFTPKSFKFRNPKLMINPSNLQFQISKLNHSTISYNNYHHRICKSNSTNSSIITKDEEDKISDVQERPNFDINLAVVLAGFAFEAYCSPPENAGKREVDSADCLTVFLSEIFLREVYDGQLFIKLKKGLNFPAMDLWGTSDPYVVMQIDGQVVKSKVKWATTDPTWEEDFTLNIKIPTTRILQVAAWDANLVTPHKRMGNAGIGLESLCDGSLHEVVVELEGLGGGGRIHLEVKYRSFDEVDEEKAWWIIPYISDLFTNSGLESTFKKVLGSDTVKAQQFVQYAFGQIKSLNEYEEDQLQESTSEFVDNSTRAFNDLEDQLQESTSEVADNSTRAFNDLETTSPLKSMSKMKENNNVAAENDGSNTTLERQADVSMQSDIWKNFADVINQTVVQKLGFPVLDKIKFDGFDLLNKIGLESRKLAEAEYVDSGLATPGTEDGAINKDEETSTSKQNPVSLLDIKKLSGDVLRQTDSILGALMVLNPAFSQEDKDTGSGEKNDINGTSSSVFGGASGDSTSEKAVNEELSIDQSKDDETKALFSTAESAMEAWAMLATSLGQSSFIKSEFEKICFLDNPSTDTQVAIWRDTVRKRLVVAFRGTEQTRWKDLRTDLMLVPAGLNPERLGGDFKQEVQVHSGFLSAYDSVRTRLLSLIKLSVGFVDTDADVEAEVTPMWHVYVTGHSLGGALATLLALELSSSQMAKKEAISVTMYNFGSPRVGNRRFVDIYNEKVKDSWRIVNHRDIIPTVPRLMGYCHVAQPIYLSAGDHRGPLDNMELLDDGYQADVIGEYTPDVLVGEFMKGEKELINKILETEINIFRAIRDGSALMQHMEDFYYITLLENVSSNYNRVGSSESSEDDSL